MSSRFGVRTYGSRHSQKAGPPPNLQFDSLIGDKNKPTAAKSAGTVLRWGKTSFTSLRNVHQNGQKVSEGDVGLSKKMKLSIPLDDDDDDPFSFDNEAEIDSNVKLEHKAAPQLDGVKALIQPRPNKFFKSRSAAVPSSSEQKFDSFFGVQKQTSPVSVIGENINTSPQMNFDSYSAKYNSSLKQTTDCLDNINLPAADPFNSMLVNKSHKTYSAPNSVKSSQSGPAISVESNSSKNYQYNATSCQGVFNQSSSSGEDSDEDFEIKTVPNRIFKTYTGSNDKKQEVKNNSHSTQSSDLPNLTPNSEILTESENIKNRTIIETIKDDFGFAEEPKSEVSEPPISSSKSTLDLIQADFDNLLEEEDEIPTSSLTVPSFCTSQSAPSVSSFSCKSNNSFGVNSPQMELLKSDYVDPVDVNNSPAEALSSYNSPAESQGDTEEMIEKETVKDVAKKPKVNTIFKNKKIFNSPKKAGERWALYKHRLFYENEEDIEEIPSPNQSSSQPTMSTNDDFDFDDENGEEPAPQPISRERRPAALTRVTTWPLRAGEEPITSVKCPKNDKELYKVVRNVKQAHQVHEIGETQEFNDDIDYLLESLEPTNSVGTRCLSILGLTTKCMVPAFRMHLRAHGTLSKVFYALQNAPSDPNLALCTASAMFVLSQDRLNMDLERESLELMLQLLESDTITDQVEEKSVEEGREFEKNRLKIRDMCAELQRKGHAKMLDLDNISAANLAMESLLSLTSRKAGEWFKEELRELGGLDHIVRTVSDCVEKIGDSLVSLDDLAVDNVRKVDRCLRVLENVTFMNTENQSYLLTYNHGQFTQCSSRVLRLLISDIHHHPPSDPPDKDSINAILVLCLLSIFKVYLNITHDNALCCRKIGELPTAISTFLSCVMYLPSHIPHDQRFDLLVLSLGMLINLVEHCDINRRKLLAAEVPCKVQWTKTEDTSAIQALVNLFLFHVESAKVEEQKTDSLLDGKKEDDNKNETIQPPGQDDIEETLKIAIQKAGRHMEDSMVAANTALLLGCAIQDDKDQARLVCSYLPNNSFETMVQILKRFLNFMSLTTAVSSTGVNIIERVIRVLESS